MYQNKKNISPFYDIYGVEQLEKKIRPIENRNQCLQAASTGFYRLYFETIWGIIRILFARC
jgi:hypothetical protein